MIVEGVARKSSLYVVDESRTLAIFGRLNHSVV